MIVKLRSVEEARETIQKFARAEMGRETALRLAPLIRSLLEELAGIDRFRWALFRKFGVQEGSRLTVKAEHFEEFQKEWDEYMENQVELPDLNFSLEEFEGLRFSPADLIHLENLGVLRL
ncbi:MAG: hypothetical protein QW835_00200 [Candidatus Hadarchaeum sp.]